MADTVNYAPKSNKLFQLEMTRGAAALFVVLLHWFHGLGYDIFNSSILAVDLFYMLSGFVMSLTYQERLSAGSSKVSYFANRVIRLWPIIVIASLLGLVRQSLRLFESTGEFVSSTLISQFVLGIFLVPADLTGPANGLAPLNAPLYSLHFEALAYLFLGVVGYKLSNRQLIIIPLAAFPFVVTWILHKFGTDVVSRDVFESPLGYLMQLSRVAFSFTIGMLLHRNLKSLQFLASRASAYALFFVMLAAMILPTTTLGPIGAIVFLVLLAPATIITGAHLDCSAKWEKWCKVAGDLSYPLYAIHVPIMWTAYSVLRMSGVIDADTAVWAGLVTIPLCLGCAAFLHYRIDVPLRGRLRTRLEASKVAV